MRSNSWTKQIFLFLVDTTHGKSSSKNRKFFRKEYSMKKNTKKKTQAQEDNMRNDSSRNRIHFVVGQSGLRAGSDKGWMKSKQYHRRGVVVSENTIINEEVNSDD